MLVAVDYFMKWAEAEALANIRDVDVKKFVWKNIVTRFGVPDSLISDNGLQFNSKAFRAFCNDLGVRDCAPDPFHRMLGQTHVNRWSRVIASQNEG